MGSKHLPSYDSGEYTERNKGKYEKLQAGRHAFDARVGGKGGGENPEHQA